MVFILYRAAVPQLPFDWYAGGRKIDMSPLAYTESAERKIDMKAPEVVGEIRKQFPEFTPCAYLNGTEKPDSFKWLLSGRIGSKGTIYGYVGSAFMEIIQSFHHLFTGRYLAYSRPKQTRLGKSMMILSAFDPAMRRIAG